MIARIWRGRTPAEKADAYLEFLERTGFSEYRATEGNRGVLALRRTQDDVVEYTLITLWESMDAIRGFAGDDPEQAKYYPDDPQFLLEMPPRVEHYAVAWSDLDAAAFRPGTTPDGQEAARE